MIFVIPVSGVDFDRFPKFVKVLKKLGGLDNHKCIVIPTKEVAKKVDEMSPILASLFASYDIIPLSMTPDGGWPLACNIHFQYAVMSTASLLDGPWMWMEVDSCPLTPNWADDLDRQYRNRGTPYMGVVRDTVNSLPGASGRHMVGFGIYPQDFSRRTVLWKYPGDTVPFDIFMQDAIIGSVTETSLIGHAWASNNYRYENGSLVCDNHNGSPVVIDSDAVVVHGVKDDSLYDLVLNEVESIPQEVSKVIQSPVIQKESMTDEEMILHLMSAGYVVIHPSQSTERLSVANQANGVQGDPATGGVSPHETKPPAEVKLAKKRGRPKMSK